MSTRKEQNEEPKKNQNGSNKKGNGMLNQIVMGVILHIFKEIFPHAKAGASATFSYATRKRLILQKKNFGSGVAILGPPASGKTTLLKFLANQDISSNSLAEYSKTEFENYNAITVKFKLNIGVGKRLLCNVKLRKNSDVGGEKYIRDQHWKEVIKDAAFIIYMIDINEISKEENFVDVIDCSSKYLNRITEDFKWLLENYQLLHENFSVLLVYNKIDKMRDMGSYSDFSNKSLSLTELVKGQIVKNWPPDLRDRIQGGLLVSVVDPALRAFWMNDLVSYFLGKDIISLLKAECSAG